MKFQTDISDLGIPGKQNGMQEGHGVNTTYYQTYMFPDYSDNTKMKVTKGSPDTQLAFKSSNRFLESWGQRYRYI